MTSEDDITPTFKSAIEQIIATHVHETNDLRRRIVEIEATSALNLEKWKKKKELLKAEIVKTKEGKQELRNMLKKAQTLLDKYRSQLRSAHQLQEQNTTDESNVQSEDTKNALNIKSPSPKQAVTPVSDPPDCYIFIPSDDTPVKKEKANTPQKKNSPKLSDTDSTPAKKTKTIKGKDSNGVQAIDLCIDAKKIVDNSKVHSDSTTNNSDTTSPTNNKPTKTKYNKYNFTPSKPSNTKPATPTTKSPPTKPVSTLKDALDDEDIYQKIYDQFSNSTKRTIDDLDFDTTTSSPSVPSKSAMPPPTTQAKKFKYVEVVRNKEDRAALPAHECDQCQKFYEALGDGYDRSKMVQHCSRHRAKDAEPETPPDYWQMSFPSSETQDL